MLLPFGSCSLMSLLFHKSVTDILVDYSVYNDDLNPIFAFILVFSLTLGGKVNSCYPLLDICC